jgi:hypothetical protein
MNTYDGIDGGAVRVNHRIFFVDGAYHSKESRMILSRKVELFGFGDKIAKMSQFHRISRFSCWGTPRQKCLTETSSATYRSASSQASANTSFFRSVLISSRWRAHSVTILARSPDWGHDAGPDAFRDA